MSGTVCEHEGLMVTLRREYKNGGVCERSECPCGYAVEFYDNSMAIPVAAPEAARSLSAEDVKRVRAALGMVNEHFPAQST